MSVSKQSSKDQNTLMLMIIVIGTDSNFSGKAKKNLGPDGHLLQYVIFASQLCILSMVALIKVVLTKNVMKFIYSSY